MSSIADTPLDILHNCIVPHVYGDVWHEIHQELRVRATLSDLGDRLRESVPRLTEDEFDLFVFLDGTLPGYSTETLYFNGLSECFSKITFVREEKGMVIRKNENAGRSYLSLAVRRHAAIRALKLLFPVKFHAVFLHVFLRSPFRMIYEDFDRPFTLMLATPFHKTVSLYVHRGQEEPFFERELIHRPGMVTLFDAFMDRVNRTRTFRREIRYWRGIQTLTDGSIHLYTRDRDV